MKVTKAKVRAFVEISALLNETGYTVSEHDFPKEGDNRIKVEGKGIKKFLTPDEIFRLLRPQKVKKPKKMSRREWLKRMNDLAAKRQSGGLTQQQYVTEVEKLYAEYPQPVEKK